MQSLGISHHAHAVWLPWGVQEDELTARHPLTHRFRDRANRVGVTVGGVRPTKRYFPAPPETLPMVA